MTVTSLWARERKARKHHRCWDCHGTIAPGETYHIHSLAMDGSAYALKQHLDCREMSNESHMAAGPHYYGDGFPPLIEDDGIMEELAHWRGYYPHVVCRIEFRQQISDIRRADRLRAKGINPDEHE